MASAIQGVFAKIADLEYPLLLVEKIMNNRECSRVLFYDNFLDPSCLSLAVSKSLGYVMIIGACLYKMPIIVNMMKSKSGTGLDPMSVYLEISAFIWRQHICCYPDSHYYHIDVGLWY